MNLPTKESPWHCADCGGEVLMHTETDRKREYLRGVHLRIPAEIEIPTCTKCGELLMPPEIAEVIDKRLSAIMRSHFKYYVDKLVSVHVVSHSTVNHILGVTTLEYTELYEGEKDPSPAIYKMVQTMTNVPGAFHYQFFETRSLKSAWHG